MSATANLPTRTLLTPDFMRRLDRLDVLSRKILQGKMQGERRSKRRGRSVEFADYRNYVPGDDPRFIDWNLYARLERLFIRLFMAEEDLSVTILLDTSRSMAWSQQGGGSGDNERDASNRLSYAKRVAAALGYIGLVHYNRVHVYAFCQSLHDAITNLRGRRPVPRLLDFIARQTAAPGKGDLATVLRRAALSQRGRGVVILISDLLDKGDLATALKYFADDRFDVYVIHLLTPDELDPDKAGVIGDLRLRDVEDDETTEVSVTPTLIKRYKERLAAWCDDARRACLRRGATYLRADTGTPFDELVLRLLRERGLVG